MVRRIVGIIIFLVLAVAVAPASALARTVAVQATDPSANTPSGTIYAIPLDSARQDAAPHKHSGSGSVAGGVGGSAGGTGSSGGSGGGSSGGGSNGGGSSATGSGSSRSVGAGARTPAVLIPGGQAGSLIHSANGFGSSSSVPGLNGPPTIGLGAVQGNASSAPLLAFLLAALVLVIGGLVGVRAWRTAGHQHGVAGRGVKGMLGPGPSDPD